VLTALYRQEGWETSRGEEDEEDEEDDNGQPGGSNPFAPPRLSPGAVNATDFVPHRCACFSTPAFLSTPVLLSTAALCIAGYVVPCDTATAILVGFFVCKPVYYACIAVCTAEHQCIQAAQLTCWTELPGVGRTEAPSVTVSSK